MAGRVEGLASGLHRYLPAPHALALQRSGDLRAELARAVPGQGWIGSAPAVIVAAAVPARTVSK